MAEDSTNPFASILGALSQKGGAKGVIKDSDGKVSPSLTPEEASRYEKIFGIMKKVVDPGPEAGKLDNSTAAKVGNTAAMKSSTGSSQSAGIPGLGALAALGAAGGIIAAALTTMTDDLLAKIESITSGIVEFADNTGDEFGKLGGLALKVGAKIGLKGLKMIPFIGSFVNFYYAYDHFSKGEYFDGAWELVSGIAGFFPGAGTVVSMLMDGYKIYAEVLANKEEEETGTKPSFSDILLRQGKELATFIGKKIADGKVPILSGLFKFGRGIGKLMTGDFKGGFEDWADILPNLLGMSWDSPMFKALDALMTIAGDNVAGAAQKGGEMAGDAWGFMKEVFSDIGEKFMGFFNGIKNWIGDMIQKGKDVIWGMIPDIFKDQGLNEIKSNPKTYSKKDKANTDQQMAAIRARVGEEEFLKQMRGPGRQDWLASQGFQAAESIQSKLKKINDGAILKNGRVTAFDDQDDLLAVKSGGPIDKMLDGNSKVMKSIASINAQQLNVLVEIRDGISALKSSGGISFNNNSLTEEFYA